MRKRSVRLGVNGYPAIQELVAEAEQNATVRAKQDDVLRFVRSRFRSVPATVESDIRGISDSEMLDSLIDRLGNCTTLEEFQEFLTHGNGDSASSRET